VTLEVIRDESAYSFESFSHRETVFQAGLTSWHLKHEALTGLSLSASVMALASPSEADSWQAGFILQVNLENPKQGDRIKLTWHAPSLESDENLLWTWDPNEDNGTDEYSVSGRFPNKSQVLRNGFRALLDEGSSRYLHLVSDQYLFDSHEDLGATQTSEYDVSSGYMAAIMLSRSGSESSEVPDLTDSMRASQLRLSHLQSLVKTSTPNEFLDAMVPFGGAALEAQYYPPLHLHGAMSWNKPYLGWRGRHGPVVVGLGQRVADEATQILRSQTLQRHSGADFSTDAFSRGSLVSKESRFYGKGHIPIYSEFYNMQEAYFDQLIQAWEWTGSQALEEELLRSLPAHLEWMQECFDPLDSGLFESYLNVWASDSIWYNGAATVQSTAYAFRATTALATLLQRHGNSEEAKEMTSRAESIKLAVSEEMWLSDRGHLAESKDRSTGVMHKDPSLYSIFLPIDAGLLSSVQQAQNLHFTRWGLERKSVEAGELCWTSNWVPYEWSVRELDYADNFHLSLAYFQAGQSKEAHKLFFGAMQASAYSSLVPGALVLAPSWPERQLPSWRKGRATDFADTVGVFFRALVEGLFGLRIKAIDELLELKPQFPSDWGHASIETKDAEISYSKTAKKVSISIGLSGLPLGMKLRIPVDAGLPKRAFVNGENVRFSLEPGIDCVHVAIETSPLSFALVEVEVEAEIASGSGSTVISEDVQVDFLSDCSILDIEDPQGAVLSWSNSEIRVKELLSPSLVRLHLEKNGVKRLHDLLIPQRKASVQGDKWLFSGGQARHVDLSSLFNCDVTNVFQVTHTAPERTGVSARLGVDGYSPWTYSFWNLHPPEISLKQGLVSSNSTTFNLNVGELNTVMTSTLEPWQKVSSIRSIDASEGQEIAILLVSSSNHMTTGVSNAMLRMYSNSNDPVSSHSLGHPKNLLHVSANYDFESDCYPLRDSAEKIKLGKNCAGTVFRTVAPKSGVSRIELEATAGEVMVGIMAVTVTSPLSPGVDVSN
jgi:hypothetical protein